MAKFSQYSTQSVIASSDTLLFLDQDDAVATKLNQIEKGQLLPVHNVTHYGAVGDGSNDDTSAIAAAITDASSGSVIYFPQPASKYKITSAIAVNKSLRLTGEMAEVYQATSATSLFTVTVSNVEIDHLKLSGLQYSSANVNEIAVYAYGADSSNYIDELNIHHCYLNSFGGYGVYTKFVSNFDVSHNKVENFRYGGIFGTSVKWGTVDANRIFNITHTSDAYGIAFTRAQHDSTTTVPRSSDITISNNVVRQVQSWEGIDTHAGQRITITGNTIYDCYIGIAVSAQNNGSAVLTFAPLDVNIIGNVIDSGQTDGSYSMGISFTGAWAGSTDPPVQYGTGSIVGNTVRGHGLEAQAKGFAIFLYATDGLTFEGNSIIEAGCNAIHLRGRNRNFSLTGNTIIDPWSDTNAYAYAIWSDYQYNTGIISGNTFATGDKNASAVLTDAIQVDNETGTDILIGTNYSEAADYLVDTGGLSRTDAVETVTGSPTLDIWGLSLLDSNGGAVTATLPDGVIIGQQKRIGMSDASTSSTVSVSHHVTSDPEVFTFAQTTDYLILEWDGTDWNTVLNRGVAT
jgi:nitrous oxidase accessory protein NosD